MARLVAASSLLILLALVVPAQAAKLQVANNGLDSPSCGAKKNPCRSIGAALAVAENGDTIVVGPGRYGDLDRDGVAGNAPGEEMPGACSGTQQCTLAISKAVKLISSAGAAATVIEGTPPDDIVGISVGGVVFGGKRRGFTLTGGYSGLGTAYDLPGVQVIENVSVGNSYGFVSRTDILLSGNVAERNQVYGFALLGDAARAIENRSSSNGLTGFLLADGARHELVGNVAIANGNSGFDSSAAADCRFTDNVSSGNTESGFRIGARHQLVGNVASGNLLNGYELAAPESSLVGNQAHGNRFHGIVVQDGSGHEIAGNSLIGNGELGVVVLENTTGSVTGNNLYGNNRHAVAGMTGCGVMNQSGAALVATNNFWGSAAGPGAEPANDVCDIGTGSTTGFSPFATKPFKIKVQAGF